MAQVAMEVSQVAEEDVIPSPTPRNIEDVAISASKAPIALVPLSEVADVQEESSDRYWATISQSFPVHLHKMFSTYCFEIEDRTTQASWTVFLTYRALHHVHVELDLQFSSNTRLPEFPSATGKKRHKLQVWASHVLKLYSHLPVVRKTFELDLTSKEMASPALARAFTMSAIQPMSLNSKVVELDSFKISECLISGTVREIRGVFSGSVMKLDRKSTLSMVLRFFVREELKGCYVLQTVKGLSKKSIVEYRLNAIQPSSEAVELKFHQVEMKSLSTKSKYKVELKMMRDKEELICISFAFEVIKSKRVQTEGGEQSQAMTKPGIRISLFS